MNKKSIYDKHELTIDEDQAEIVSGKANVLAARVDDYNNDEVYKNKIGYEADFYVVDIGSGPVELQ